MAGHRALKKSVVALRVKQSFFVKSDPLKAVVDICGQHKVILVFYELQEIGVNGLRYGEISVDFYVPRPIAPKFLGRFIRIKAAAIHILEPVF